MTLEWTTIDVPLGAGLDTKTNEKLLKPPACADLSDAIFPASGVAGYETRKGYDRIRTNTVVSRIDATAIRDNELLALADSKLYSVTELENNVDLVDKGKLLAVGVKQENLDTRSSNQTLGQICIHNGVQVHCYLDSSDGNVHYVVTNIATGGIIGPAVSLADSSAAKLCKAGDSILVVYHNSSTTAIRCTVVPTYAPATTSDVEVVSDSHADGIFDVIEANSDFCFLAYKSSTGTATTRSVLINQAGTDSNDTAVADVTYDLDCIAVAKSGFGLVVAASDGSNVILCSTSQTTFNTIDTFSVDPTVLAGCINIAYAAEQGTTGAETDYNHTVWCEFAGASAQFNYVTMSVGLGVAAVAPETPTSTLRHNSLASTAFYLDGNAYVHTAFDTALQRQYFMIDNVGNIHAKCCTLGGVGIGAGNVAPHLPRVIDGIWAPVFREHLQIDVDPDVTEVVANVYAQYGLKKVTYDTSHRPASLQFGGTSYTQSGVLWAYDGTLLAEQGFHVYPEGITEQSQGLSGSLTQLGSYSYRVYYEWTNARGERQRSSTASVETVVLTGSNDEITLRIPTLSHTSKGTNVSIVVYRTESDPNIVGGAPFYRVSSPDPTATGANGYVANDPTVDYIDFNDELSDLDLLTHELDYLNSGELDNVSPPSATVIGEAKGRVLLAGFEDENSWRYSKLNTRGRDQLEFNDSLENRVPEAGGAITAFGELNFHIVIFKANSCYAVSGEGKNNVGAGFFNLPQVASLDVGCIEPRSVVNVPKGIMFKSEKGIWLLGHNLDMQYVGANVEAYNNQGVSAVTVIPEENHVLFLTSSGSTLVYNYLLGEWSRFTNHEGVSAQIWNGTYVYARNDGKLYKQSATSYSDDGVHYSMRFVTAPVGIKGVQGKQKIRHIRLLGEYYSPHELRVGLRFNHEPGTSDEGTWDPSDGITIDFYGSDAYGDGIYGGDGSPVYQARFNMPRQKCQTIQFVIDTKNTSGAGRAMSIQAIQISVGAKRGLGNVSVDSSFSGTGASTGGE